MEKTEILNEIQVIFRNILDDDTIVLNEETTANDVEDWDSLSHIQIVVAVEKHFGIKFSAKEILSWKNVGEMIDCIIAK